MANWSYITADSWAYTVQDIISLHKQIHDEYGNADKIPDEVISAEQILSMQMRSNGLEHRHDDKLSRKAATYRPNPLPFTMSELWAYLQYAITLESVAVRFVKTEKNGRIYAIFKGLDGREDMVLRAINRSLPPGVPQITRLNGTAKSDFLYVYNALSLQLVESPGRYEEVVTTWDTLNSVIQKSAAEASVVFKSDVEIPFRVIKSDHPVEEHIVTSVVLEPETPDNTKTKETDGDIYSVVEICKAMYWWMENAGNSFSYQHTMPETRAPSPWAPGKPLTSKEIKLLENWQTRVDQEIGGQLIQKGTWMTTARILDGNLWAEIKAGRITGWSVGMESLGKVELYEIVDQN